MAGLVRAGDVAAYSIANATFHELIYRGSHNAYLGDITMQTRRRLAPFRKAQFSNLGRLVGSHAEHSDIVTALLRGECKRASDLMRAHLATVGASFVQHRP
jgi:DNA-binding GntR family transcriptional regulator